MSKNIAGIITLLLLAIPVTASAETLV